MLRSRRIGILVDAVRSYGRGVISGIVAYRRANPNWKIAAEPVWSFGSTPDVNQMDVDGLIVQSFSEAFQEKVIARNLPSVNVSSVMDEIPRIPTVLPDPTAIGKMAADYLLSLNLREVGYVWPGEMGFARTRLDAFRARAMQKGARFHECNTKTENLGDWLANIPKPAGILGCNDDWGRSILKAADARGIKVPQQIAVLGVDDDIFFNTLLTPALSSVAFPAEEVGYRAAALLDRLIDGKAGPTKPITIKPTRVVVRGSSDMAWVGDDEIATALHFIRANAGRPLQVDDVQEQVPLSRRSLTRRFQQKVGSSVSDEIRRAHIERAKHLLITTDMSTEQIATASGCVNACRLAVLFRREIGETPTEFRKRSRLGLRNNVISEPAAEASYTDQA